MRSDYNEFVKQFFAAHRGQGTAPMLMKAAAVAWRTHKSGGRIIAINGGARLRHRRHVGARRHRNMYG